MYTRCGVDREFRGFRFGDASIVVWASDDSVYTRDMGNVANLLVVVQLKQLSKTSSFSSSRRFSMSRDQSRAPNRGTMYDVLADAQALRASWSGTRLWRRAIGGGGGGGGCDGTCAPHTARSRFIYFKRARIGVYVCARYLLCGFD